MKDRTRKGILAKNIMDTYFVQDISEVVSETKTSRINSRNQKTSSKQYQEPRRKKFDDDYYN